MEISVIQDIINLINNNVSVLKFQYAGYYPWDFDKVPMNLPCVLVKLGDTNVTAMGHRRYLYDYTTLLIMFWKVPLTTSMLTILQSLLDKLYVYFTTPGSTAGCIRFIDTWTILTGDITEYTLPSNTGYNNNIMVRKLTLNYTLQRTI